MNLSLKCLLVDDNDSILQLLSMFMETLGFQSFTAHDGDEGIAAVRKHRPDLVVSDIHMPNRNGLLLLQDIKEMNPALPVILITGYHDYKSDMVAIKTQPDAFMEKPFSFDELRDTVERLSPAALQAWTIH